MSTSPDLSQIETLARKMCVADEYDPDARVVPNGCLQHTRLGVAWRVEDEQPAWMLYRKSAETAIMHFAEIPT